LERLRKCCGVGTGECGRTRGHGSLGPVCPCQIRSGTWLCTARPVENGPFEKGGREEKTQKYTACHTQNIKRPSSLNVPHDAPVFAAGRALHSPCLCPICSSLQNQLRCSRNARVTGSVPHRRWQRPTPPICRVHRARREARKLQGTHASDRAAKRAAQGQPAAGQLSKLMSNMRNKKCHYEKEKVIFEKRSGTLPDFFQQVDVVDLERGLWGGTASGKNLSNQCQSCTPLKRCLISLTRVERWQSSTKFMQPGRTTHREATLPPRCERGTADGDVRLSHGQNLYARREKISWRERSYAIYCRGALAEENFRSPRKIQLPRHRKATYFKVVERLCTRPIGKSYTRSPRIVTRQTCSYTALENSKKLINSLAHGASMKKYMLSI
jgi:hypothetical protein